MARSADTIRRLARAPILLLGSYEEDASYVVTLAGTIEEFTLERIEALGNSTAELVVLSDDLKGLGDHWPATFDARSGIGDGRSSADRARTMRVIARIRDPLDVISPGHVGARIATHHFERLCRCLATGTGHASALAVCAVRSFDGKAMSPSSVRNDGRFAHLGVIPIAVLSPRGPAGPRERLALAQPSST